MSETLDKSFEINRETYDHINPERLAFKPRPGVSEDLVREISRQKNEPEWMLRKRLEGLKRFNEMSLPDWGPSLKDLNLDEIYFFMRPDAKRNAQSWEDVPADIRKTYEKLGIPEAEKKALAGVGAQYEADVIYHKLKEEWEKKGVIFLDCDEAVQKHPELVKKYFMTTCVPIGLHKFSALHAAVWSGGTFIYVPKGVKLDLPLQAYFRMNARQGGQFEHTLIIVDEDAQVQYIEGCFTKGNIVTTNPDYKLIEDIKADEKVLTSEGEFKKTRDVQSSLYTGTICTIEVWGDSIQKIEVTPEHPFLYVDKQRKNERNKTFTPRWNIPRYFRKGDYLVMPINKTVRPGKTHTFTIKRHIHNKKVPVDIIVPLIPEFFRLVGYYLAEGSVSSDSYLNFSFSSKEKGYIADVKACLKKVFEVENTLEIRHKKNHGTSVVVCSVELARLFKQFGTKCDNKAVPSWMMYEKPEHQKEIIKGWFRGDGNYYCKHVTSGLKEVCRINTTSEKLLRQGRDMLLRLGVVAFMNRRDRSKENRKAMFTLGITGAFMKPFGDLVGIQLSDKLHGKNRASLFGISEKFAFLPIRSITKREVKNLPVYNFGVEDHETYTVGGVAVHNCSAPQYAQNSLHAGCVEIHVLKGARARYSSIENWSRNTYNLNTKRAVVEEEGVIEWVNGNMGSCVTMLYPSSYLKGDRSKSDFIGIAFAGKGQNQDTGCKVVHVGKNTSSHIVSKSISKDGGITSYRGLLSVRKGATNIVANVQCDALMMDAESKSNTFPYMDIKENSVEIAHEATVGRISKEQIFYLMSRGLDEETATKMIVSGFVEPIVKELPMEYAVELNRLIELEMEGSLG
ncbi:Fe-S cluster assembly protein SufB [Candidatus Woesearchaeota archaeon]|nr:Fe-S cluster assembly protein SufB [Candidatus Woesearchaeota archaeon]